MSKGLAPMSKKPDEGPQIPFPLPPQTDPSLCRDAFLRELLKPYETEVKEDVEDDVKAGIAYYTKDSTQYSEAEEMLLIQFRERGSIMRRPAFLKPATEERPFAPDLNQLLRQRYKNMAEAISFLGVLYHIQKLKDRLHIVGARFRMKTALDRSMHIFSWAINHYYERFKQPNTVYLDALEKDLSKNQIECYKFHMDMKEILRLLDAVYKDVKLKRDICSHSMLIIRDAELNINDILISTEAQSEQQHMQLAWQYHQHPRSADPARQKFRALEAKVNKFDFIHPIEARYRINWAESLMQQSIAKDEAKLRVVTDELQEYWHLIKEGNYMFEIAIMAYDQEIGILKKRISAMEQKYEADLEVVENELQMTRNRVAKAREDLKVRQEKVVMFRIRVEEVKAIFAKIEEANRISMRQSSVKPPPKPDKKNKKKK